MNELLQEYEEKYRGIYTEDVETDSVLLRRVKIGGLYCEETGLDVSVDEILDKRLRELSALGEEDLIDCIFDYINAPIYRKMGKI